MECPKTGRQRTADDSNFSMLPQSLHRTATMAARQERFLALLDPVYERLESFAFAMEPDREKALDLVGETVLRAWEQFERLNDPAAFLKWLLVTARRIRMRRLWRRRLFGEYDERYAADLREASVAPDLSVDIAALHDALACLPERQREAIVLHEITGLSLKEILPIQGGTLSALKVRLHRGRKELARLLGVDDTPIEGGVGERPDRSASQSSPNIPLP